MPPLRDRPEDVPQIVDFFLQSLVKQKKARVSKVSPEAMAVLTRYKWPGNVRELENVIYRSAVIAQGDAILVKDLPADIRSAAGIPVEVGDTADGAAPATSAASSSLESALDGVFKELRAGGDGMLGRFERELAVRAMSAESGDEARAAKLLGVSKAALQKLLAG
jgi:two-component system nitrogen regulation response regulator GlnG